MGGGRGGRDDWVTYAVAKEEEEEDSPFCLGYCSQDNIWENRSVAAVCGDVDQGKMNNNSNDNIHLTKRVSFVYRRLLNVTFACFFIIITTFQEKR